MPTLIPQPHGGALLSGGKPGTTPGTGRPRSAIRDHLAGAFADRIPTLERMADGVTHLTMQERCAACGYEPPEKRVDVRDIAVSADTQLKALAKMGELGQVAGKELSETAVRERLEATYEALVELLPPDLFDAVSVRLSAVWT